MVCYYGDVRNPIAKDIMIADVQVVVGGVNASGMEPDEVEVRILRPVGAELIARYGHEVGPRLHAEFLKTFDDVHCEC